MQTTDFQRQLMNLFTDDRFKNLTTTQNFENYYNVNGINEARNIFTLSWLLNPKGSHGLKDLFMKEFVQMAWTWIHQLKGVESDYFKKLFFYKNLSPLSIRTRNFDRVEIDRNYQSKYPAIDLMISDIDNKLMIIVNNNYNKEECDRVYNEFTSSRFDYFTHKLFISFDGVTHNNSKWSYINNTWIINLITNLLEAPYHNGERYFGQLKEFYHFLTGTPYGMNHDYYAETIASLVNDYHETFCFLKEYRTEKNLDQCLININPVDYATQYMNKINETDLEILQTYWMYRSAFNTFFQISNYEMVTRTLNNHLENKNYTVNRQYVRNGIAYTPYFFKDQSALLNNTFIVEARWDINNRLNLDLVINKKYWDKLTKFQKNLLQQRLGFNSEVLTDRFIVTSTYFGDDWMKKDLGNEIMSCCDKINQALESLTFKVA